MAAVGELRYIKDSLSLSILISFADKGQLTVVYEILLIFTVSRADAAHNFDGAIGIWKFARSERRKGPPARGTRSIKVDVTIYSA